jgi:hypothetical protein
MHSRLLNAIKKIQSNQYIPPPKSRKGRSMRAIAGRASSRLSLRERQEAG